jgi:hypothetical protein
MMANDVFAPQIKEFLSEPDNIEKLRDHIAVLVKGETENQHQLALGANAKNAEDFNFRVFVENARPYETENENDTPPVTPFINIMLQKAAAMESNARIGNQKEKATFIIDCIAFGNEGGEEWNKKVAAARAWMAAGVIRKIIMSEQYAYLGLRGKVGSRNILSIETGISEEGGEAFNVITARITLEVQFIETFIGDPGVPFEAFNYSIIPSSGEVFINNN